MSSHGRYVERLDPEVSEALDKVPLLDLRDIPATRVARERLALAARERWATPEGITSENLSIPGSEGQPDVTVRVHRRTESQSGRAALLWVHGGGHVLGDAAQDDPLLQGVASRTGSVVVSVDWRRAPENPYPSALDDCWTSLQWLAESADDLGVDRDRIVVAGASSGGGIAAGLVLLTRDRGGPPIAAQVLVYPMLDDRVTDSNQAFNDRRIWHVESNGLAWDAYLGDLRTGDVPPYAAPARATDLAGLPQTWMATSELDLFLDEDVDYARRLMAAGVQTELHVYPGATHGFDVFAPESAVAKRLWADRDAALDRFLS